MHKVHDPLVLEHGSPIVLERHVERRAERCVCFAVKSRVVVVNLTWESVSSQTVLALRNSDRKYEQRRAGKEPTFCWTES